MGVLPLWKTLTSCPAAAAPCMNASASSALLPLRRALPVTTRMFFFSPVLGVAKDSTLMLEVDEKCLYSAPPATASRDAAPARENSLRRENRLPFVES